MLEGPDPNQEAIPGEKLPDFDPQGWRAYSGKTLVRMPESLHGELSRLAREHKISMNRLIVYLLAWGVGRAAMPPERRLGLAKALHAWKRKRYWISVDR